MVTYEIGDNIRIKNEGYYSGTGVIKAIEKWKDGRTMMAVYFQGKGTVWYDIELL